MTSQKPSPRAQSVLGALRALSTEIDILDHVAADRYGLNLTDMSGLDIVGQAGPISPTHLAHRMGFTTGGITSVLDRLERAGYVRRVADPHDRRRLLIEKTDATAERDREVFGDLARKTVNSLRGYSEAELVLIQGFLERTREITAAHAGDLARNRPNVSGRPVRGARAGE